MLELPNITLIVAETRCHELMRITLTDMVLKVKFGGVVIHTDKPELIGIPAAAEYVRVPDWPDKSQQGTFYYMNAPCAAKTSHALLMEWDAGLRDASMWSDDFLQYDYIGAPWMWARGKRHTVGNGGFVLISKRMADYVDANRNTFRINTDVAYSQANRMRLEREIGAKWAPEDVAYRFSFEHGPGDRAQAKPSFGYHDIFNWPLALGNEEVLRRARLVMANSYIIRNTPKMKLLGQYWPWVRHALGDAEYDAAIRHHFPTASIRRRPNPMQLAQKTAILRRHGVKA